MTDDSQPEPTAPADDPNPQQGDPADAALGDAGKAALKAERDRANSAEKALRTLQAQHDEAAVKAAALEQAQQDAAAQLAARDLALTRLNVAYDKGLPKELASRLQGDDEAALQADADALLALIPHGGSSTTPRPDPSQGARTPAASTPQDAFAAFMGPLLNP